MSYYSGPTKEEMFNLLVMKTRELGRLVTFEEADADERLPKANNYSWHWEEYSKAAEAAWSYVKRYDENGVEIVPKGVVVLAKKGFKRLDPDREKTVMNELAEMYAKEGGKLPSSRSIKKNRYIKEEEVESIKRAGLFTEHKLEPIAVANFGYVPKPKPEVVQPDPVALNEPKLEPEVVVNEELPVEPEGEQEVETMEETKGRTAVRYTKQECEEKFRAACEKAGHILSRAETEALCRKGVLPGWVTLTRRLKPWDEWNKKFGLPWGSELTASIAEKTRRKRMLKEEAAKAETPEPDVSVNVELEEPETEEAKSEEVSGSGEVIVPEEAFGPEAEAEGDPSEEDDEDEETVIELQPIRVVLPAGMEGVITEFHGTINLTIEF